eukprot:TRINITY_DN90995_c0_g1_i1.p1 TRINITY_DN90995_c0_g1~~TRINITY_DN90995_c0_g1_i1.p1  ORF type:complete len:254 (+),score=56.87 TRINITY_DN90995_c0_g1_i1:75-836(+)
MAALILPPFFRSWQEWDESRARRIVARERELAELQNIYAEELEKERQLAEKLDSMQDEPRIAADKKYITEADQVLSNPNWPAIRECCLQLGHAYRVAVRQELPATPKEFLDDCQVEEQPTVVCLRTPDAKAHAKLCSEVETTALKTAKRSRKMNRLDPECKRPDPDLDPESSHPPASRPTSSGMQHAGDTKEDIKAGNVKYFQLMKEICVDKGYKLCEVRLVARGAARAEYDAAKAAEVKQLIADAKAKQLPK